MTLDLEVIQFDQAFAIFYNSHQWCINSINAQIQQLFRWTFRTFDLTSEHIIYALKAFFYYITLKSTYSQQTEIRIKFVCSAFVEHNVLPSALGSLVYGVGSCCDEWHIGVLWGTWCAILYMPAIQIGCNVVAHLFLTTGNREGGRGGTHLIHLHFSQFVTNFPQSPL